MFNFFKKKEKKEEVYLLFYKIQVKENEFRENLSTNTVINYVNNFFKKAGYEIKYYQVKNINNDYYVFYSNVEPVNKELYCMMLLTLCEIQNENYKGAEERYYFKQEELNNLKIKIYKK